MKNEKSAALRLRSMTVVAYAATVAAFLLIPAAARAQSDATAYLPRCRNGYMCVQNQCVSACNPQCGANQTCTATGECIDKNISPTAPMSESSSAPISSAPPATAPPAAAGGSVLQDAAPNRGGTTAQPGPTGAPVAPLASPHAPTLSGSAPPAPAASADGVHMHDGWYFRAALGVSFMTSSTAALPNSGGDIDLSGTGAGLELALGKTLQRGIVVGGGIYGQSVSSPKYSMGGASATGGQLSASSVGPFVDWYPDPAGGLHAEASVGLAVVTAKKSDQFPPSDISGHGFSLLAGVGYEMWVGDQVSIGVLARLQYAQADVKADGATQSLTMKLVTPALLASLTYQ